jgi:hypothetical protein
MEFHSADIEMLMSGWNTLYIRSPWKSSGLLLNVQNVEWFGSLRWSSVILKKSLLSLAHGTAIAAMDAFYRGQSPFHNHQNEITAAITELAVLRASGEIYSALGHRMEGNNRP